VTEFAKIARFACYYAVLSGVSCQVAAFKK